MAAEIATLRALTFRISSTPTSLLPYHVPAITASLANCRNTLSSNQTYAGKAPNSEASVAIHKYRTLISTLLQDRTIHGRWSAIVLVKASIEAGGWETLQKCLPWVRGLLSYLSKPDPPSSKKLCIITLTRIFSLTKEFPTLVREITTPSLPTFIQSCLQIANARPLESLLRTILDSFNQLLPRHPTVFRSYLKQIRQLLLQLIAPTPSSRSVQELEQTSKQYALSDVSNAACQLYVQTSCCAPKAASSEDWALNLKNAVESAHQTADKVFRAVQEEWRSPARDQPQASGLSIGNEPRSVRGDCIGLPPWHGTYAGSERLGGVLRLIKYHLICPTAMPVGFEVGTILDLTTRMFSMTLPSSGRNAFRNSLKLNNSISKEERESLWTQLPAIHVTTMEILQALADRVQMSTLALDAIAIDQLTWLFECENHIAQVRTAVYRTIATLLRRSGMTLSKENVDSMVPLIRFCCEDILPAVNISRAKTQAVSTKTSGKLQSQSSTNADAILSSTKTLNDAPTSFPGLKNAACNLLPIFLTNISAQYLSDSLRARLDRTALLSCLKAAVIASTLNPPPSKKFGKPAASILPLMARLIPQAQEVESILRPKLPVVRLGHIDCENGSSEQDVDEGIVEAYIGKESRDPSEDRDHFPGQDLETYLDSVVAPELGIKEQEAFIPLTTDVGAITYEVEVSEPILQTATSSSELIGSTENVKRDIYDVTASTPNKRIKIVTEDIHSSPKVTTIVPASLITRASHKTTTDIINNVSFEKPQKDKAMEVDEDSDDEDIIPLVMDDDTESESD